MSESAKLHDEKYQSAKAAGLPGWGGVSRIFNLPKILEERFYSFSGIPSGGRLLELGCGAGNLSILLAKRGFEVSGVDFSESAITWAKENAERASLNINFNVADVTNLSLFRDETFDVVYDGNCFHCILGEKRVLALKEWGRILKTNGILFISSLCASENDSAFPKEFNSLTRVLTETNVAYRFIPTPEAIVSELLSAGFKVVREIKKIKSPFGHINIHAVKA